MFNSVSPFTPDSKWESRVLLSWLLEWCALSTNIFHQCSLKTPLPPCWLMRKLSLEIVHSEKVELLNLWLGGEHSGHSSPRKVCILFFSTKPCFTHNPISQLVPQQKYFWLVIKGTDCKIKFMKSKPASDTCWMFLGEVTLLGDSTSSSIKQGWCSASWFHWRVYMV